MNGLRQLHPFAEAPPVTVRAGAECRPEGLFLRYLLGGELSSLFLPPRGDAPSRQDKLWETTCLECFFGLRDLPGYWEVNLSPTGDWNVYAFTDYRQGMRMETAIGALAITTTASSDTLAITVLLPTAKLFGPDETIQAGLCAVLQERSGQKSFWALTHPAAQPDFHARQGLVLELSTTAGPSMGRRG